MNEINWLYGSEHTVDRGSLYDDVLKLYKEGNITNEYPIYIRFKGEIAVDVGGVQRDMLSGFWETAYKKLFEGHSILTPMFHPQTDHSIFPILGRIISHGYLVTGILPIRIALPTLLSILLGPTTEVPQRILVDAFLEFVNADERNTIKEALSFTTQDSFPASLRDDLISIFGNFGCRTPPKPATLVQIIFQVSKYELLTKPAAAIALINSGIPDQQRNFWNKLSISKIEKLYHTLTVNSKRVLSLLSTPYFCTSQEERVYGYFRTMIADLSTKDLRHLLRFITGSSVCSSKISIQFNGITGLARRPIAHTCDSTLELSTAYQNYDDFMEEFRCILSHTEDEFSWRMDSF